MCVNVLSYILHFLHHTDLLLTSTLVSLHYLLQYLKLTTHHTPSPSHLCLVSQRTICHSLVANLVTSHMSCVISAQDQDIYCLCLYLASRDTWHSGSGLLCSLYSVLTSMSSYWSAARPPIGKPLELISHWLSHSILVSDWLTPEVLATDWSAVRLFRIY